MIRKKVQGKTPDKLRAKVEDSVSSRLTNQDGEVSHEKMGNFKQPDNKAIIPPNTIWLSKGVTTNDNLPQFCSFRCDAGMTYTLEEGESIDAAYLKISDVIDKVIDTEIDEATK